MSHAPAHDTHGSPETAVPEASRGLSIVAFLATLAFTALLLWTLLGRA